MIIMSNKCKILEVESLSKKFGNKYAVKDLSFEIYEGEVYCLVGPNGAGKTTTLRMIVGLLTPTSGRVKIMGIDVHKNREKAMRYITYVPDVPVLYSELTVVETLLLYASLRGVDRHVAERRIEDLIEKFELKDYRDVKVRSLSRGTLQKLVIAMSFLPDPKLIVMDEPFMALDVHMQKVLKDEIRERSRMGTSFLISSHVIPWVEEIASRVCVIYNGIKVIEGSIEYVKTKLGGITLEEALLSILKAE